MLSDKRKGVENELVPHRMTRRVFGTAVVSAIPMFSSLSNAATASPLRVGVIGHTGRGDYGHGLDKAWLSLPETRIVGLADADPNGLKQSQLALKAEHVSLSYVDMIRQAQPEIVAICPRHIDQRRDMILAAVNGGARGIYCEKPFCKTLQEADEIVAACEKSGTKLAVAHRNRYHPVLPIVKSLISDGAIGKLLEIRGRGKEDRRGGAEDLWVLGTHVLNLASYFAGQPTSCSAQFYIGDRPVHSSDVVDGAEGIGPVAGNRLHARFETDTSVPVFFDSIQNMGTRAAGFGLQLIGTEGIIDFRIDVDSLAHLVRGNPFQPDSKPRVWVPISSAGIGVPEPLQDITSLVANHLLATRDLIASISEDRQPLCGMHEGRTTVEMVQATFASQVADGQNILMPLKNRSHPYADWKSSNV
jgi:predicted dehydrogenase